MANLSNCNKCDWKTVNQGDGHCYMFKEEPADTCYQFKREEKKLEYKGSCPTMRAILLELNIR